MVTSWRRWILGAVAVVGVAGLLASCTGFFGTDIGRWDPPPPSGVLPAPNPVSVAPELDMELGAGLDASDLTPAVIAGPNHEFGLVPAAVAGRTVTFSLLHFSDPTAGKGTATGKPVPDSAEGRAMTVIAEDLAQGVKLNTAYAQIMEQWYDQGVKAQLDGASSDLDLENGIMNYVDWYFQIDSLENSHGISGLANLLRGRIADGPTRYAKRIDGIVRAGVKACKQNADPQQGWDLTGWPDLVDTVYQLLAYSDSSDSLPQPDVQSWADAISSCLHFIVYYTHLISVDGGTDFYFQAVASATPELQVEFYGAGTPSSGWRMEAKDASDEIATLGVRVKECHVSTWSRVPSTFHVVSIHALRESPSGLFGNVELDPNMTLAFDPGDPRVTGTVRCADGTSGALNAVTGDLWRTGFAALRIAAGGPPTRATLKSWTMPYQTYVAHAHLGQTSDTFTEDGDLDIAHEPL